MVEETTEGKAGAPGIPWLEKYRPTSLSDVIGNDEAVKRLRIIAKNGNMQNLILTGPPGTGKTTSVLCLARELLTDNAKDAILELNASDARGIDVVRQKIKGFAQKKVTLKKGRHKIIVLDEVDSMTTGAQQALRRIMEKFTSTTRFALACNSSNKLIEPIQSRCAILRYQKLTDNEVTNRIQQIISLEKVLKYDEEGIKALVFTAQGDLRNAINNLQATASGTGFVNAENVFKVVDQPHPLMIRRVIESAVEKDLMSAIKHMQVVHEQGYSGMDIINTLFRVCKTVEFDDEGRKLLFIKEIGYAHIRIADGVASLLQLNGLIARLCMIE
jgi:replication factor C subunit 2/4